MKATDNILATMFRQIKKMCKISRLKNFNFRTFLMKLFKKFKITKPKKTT